MQLIIFKQDTDAVSAIEVPNDADAELLIQMIQAEMGIPLQEQRLEIDGIPIREGSLAAQGIVDGTAIVVRQETASSVSSCNGTVPNPLPNTQSQPAVQASPARGRNNQLLDPSSCAPEKLLEFVREYPETLVQYKRIDPELGALIEEGDVGKMRIFVMKRAMSRHKIVYEAKMEEIALFSADPMDPEVQKKIAEKIRLQNVQENLDNAMENLPEAFGRVTMLYVNLHINNQPVKAFVDSGAQITIMSKRCAEACGIAYLIDTRMSSQLKGVGTSQSLGRIHSVQMKFGNSFMAVSITVVPNDDMDFLFGLDNLRRLRGVIDLNRNVLCLDGAGGREEVSFLGEHELPNHAKGHFEGEDNEDGSGAGVGTNSSASSGADNSGNQKEGGMDTSS